MILWVRDPCWYLIVPTRSSRSRWGGNKPARAFDAKGCLRQLRERTGHNASERRAGPENVSRESRPSSHKGKADVQGSTNDGPTMPSLDFTGVVTMARRKGTSTQTREIRLGGRLEATNRSFVRSGPGSDGSRRGS